MWFLRKFKELFEVNVVSSKIKDEKLFEILKNFKSRDVL